jgi:Flp pilus assembly protein TadD
VREAIDSYRTALELKPGWAEAHNSLGVALLDGDEFGSASEAFSKAASLRPDWFLPFYNLGKAAFKRD